MKANKLLILFVLLFFAKQTWAGTETEPNDTKATANTLVVNDNNTGVIGIAGDQDWFAITTNEDGKIDVTITVSNGLRLNVFLYDNDGATQLAYNYTNSTGTISFDGAAGGTYYVKLNSYYAGQLPAYTVSNTLTVPAEANDAEPNGTKAQAKVLPLNGSKTGHVNYYYNLQRDSVDWYKVTTNADGLLRITATSGNGQRIYVYLYDNDGTTQLNNAYSETSVVLNTDGLAVGTYYVKVKTYYVDGFVPYTLADSLFEPTQANDAEPNGTKAQAKVLPLNGSKTGHVNYYYNLQKDSADWYKVTTNVDGLLRITATPANGKRIRVFLYDKDGTTLLNSTYSTLSAVINTDGLAAGTYYVKVASYYSYEFEPYTLSDSLFEPAQANDAEPNNSKDDAITLPLNGSKTGHVGYYYNLQRDSADWHKVTTNADGQLRVTATSANGQRVYVYLYDNNGTTLLSAAYSTTSAVISVDGLTSGTYYIKVNCYYNYEFVPYTLSDSLFTYSNAIDTNENGKPYQAKTMMANSANEGHVGFYYNNTRDTVDWWKINYTGSGDLKFTINEETLKSGGVSRLYFQVYKDTSAAPIHSSYNDVASRTVNLTSLTQGYYWIKLFSYYNYQFTSYSITDSFTQVNIAKINVRSFDTVSSCSSTNKIIFKPGKSNPAYTVQLYRFGVVYGAPVIKSNNHTITFNNLPTGSYYATIFGDGATGTAYGKSKNIIMEPIPGSLSTSTITDVKAKLNWAPVECAGYYTIQFRVQGDPTWIKRKTKDTSPYYIWRNLTPNTTYEWQVATSDSANGIVATGQYSSISTFKTDAAFVAGKNGNEVSLTGKGNIKETINSISVFPNPATNYFTIRYNSSKEVKVNAVLYNLNGKAVWVSGAMNASALNGSKVVVNNFASGLYYLKIMDEKGEIQSVIKISIIK